MSLKKMLLCAAAALGLCVNASAQIKCEVNECFELTSIVFRLAGAEEYVINDLEKYTSAVDKYFERYKKTSPDRLLPTIALQTSYRL